MTTIPDPVSGSGEPPSSPGWFRRLLGWLARVTAPQPCPHYWTFFLKTGDWYCLTCDEVIAHD